MPSNDAIDALESDYLYTKLSQIEGSGNGLFTAVDIYKNETIAVFAGELLTGTEATKRAGNGDDRYFITLSDGRTLDPMNVPCFTKYANAAQAERLRWPLSHPCFAW